MERHYFTFGTNHVLPDGSPAGNKYVVVEAPTGFDHRAVFIAWLGSDNFSGEYTQDEWEWGRYYPSQPDRAATIAISVLSESFRVLTATTNWAPNKVIAPTSGSSEGRMNDQTSETRRRRWCLDHERYYPLSPAELYVLLVLADIPGWELVTEEVRQITVGQWFCVADSVKDQADLLKLQQTAVNDYRMECDRAEGRLHE